MTSKEAKQTASRVDALLNLGGDIRNKRQFSSNIENNFLNTENDKTAATKKNYMLSLSSFFSFLVWNNDLDAKEGEANKETIRLVNHALGKTIKQQSKELLATEFGVRSFVLFNDAWSQKGHSTSNTTVILA